MMLLLLAAFIQAASKLLADDVDSLWAESGALVQFALGPRTHTSVLFGVQQD